MVGLGSFIRKLFKLEVVSQEQAFLNYFKWFHGNIAFGKLSCFLMKIAVWIVESLG